MHRGRMAPPTGAHNTSVAAAGQARLRQARVRRTLLKPNTGFGFKQRCTREANTSLLIDFLDQRLPPGHQIAERPQ